VPHRFDLALTTTPYYRSAFAFVTRADRQLDIRSFDDPGLKWLKIGIQVVGEDGANPPPAYALAARGIVDNVVGFSVYGDYAQPNPPARLIDAVTNGEVDVAVAWGPLAGYFAKRANIPLTVTPVADARDSATGLPMAFDISMGVKKGNAALRDELNTVLARRLHDVERILNEYGVPRVPPAAATRPSDAERAD
jgi:mxaJ protein